MTYDVTWSARARRALAEELPPRVVSAVVAFVVEVVADNPQRVGKALRGEREGLYAARRADYRVIYRVKDEELIVLVIDIRHRAHSYRT